MQGLTIAAITVTEKFTYMLDLTDIVDRWMDGQTDG